MPKGGALCRFYALCGVWQDSHRMAAARAIRRHWTALCLGGNGAGGNPQGYATVLLPDHRYLIIIGRHWDFLKLIPWEYIRVCVGMLSPGTSLHNGTARPGLMPCMGGRLFYADRHSRQPDQFMDGLSVPGKWTDQQGFLPSIDLSDKNE